jgi:hypothetical protein
VARKYQIWPDYTDTPLNESIEQYSVEIYNTGDQLIRTFTVNAETVLYTGVNRLADLGSFTTAFYVKIYQITPVIGRGFESRASVQ